jgi:hypothetical protein
MNWQDLPVGLTNSEIDDLSQGLKLTGIISYRYMNALRRHTKNPNGGYSLDRSFSRHHV